LLLWQCEPQQSRARLFSLVYVVGIVVTVFLSNDATAVVLTPAVYAAVKRAGADALAYLLVCAFIDSAASFVLPISNPANLVVFGKDLPPLAAWLRTFFLPSLSSIVITFAILRWLVRNEIKGTIPAGANQPALSDKGRRAAWGIVASGTVLIAASALGFDLGLPTCATAVLTVLVTTGFRERGCERSPPAFPGAFCLSSPAFLCLSRASIARMRWRCFRRLLKTSSRCRA
jgi:arsenical pump membrane protein